MEMQLSTRFTVPLVEDPAFRVQGALYFLEDAGHFLFRQVRDGSVRSKFVTLQDVTAAFAQKEEDSGWLPAGVVRVGHNEHGDWFVYSAPGQKVVVEIEGEEPITTAIPRTVLVGIGRAYYLFAMAGKYFSASEKAYLAPFPNVHGDGKICWGVATPPEARAKVARQVWDLFFGTLFNAHLVDGKSKSEKEDVRKVLRKLAETGAREYPVKDLVVVGNMIGTVVDHLVGA